MPKSCIRWGSSLLLVLLLDSISAQTIHIAHCRAGCPTGAPLANEIVVRHLFAASINYQTGLADWVAYRVLPGTIGVASLLPRIWEADALVAQPVPEEIDSGPRYEQPDLSNQQDSVYRVTEIIVNAEDRGRLVPMSSFAGTPYWDDLNYLSNMTPIPVDLRVGAWARLDQAVNELATRVGDVFVVSGPLYTADQVQLIRRSAVTEPVAFFKLIATGDRYAAFLFPADLAQHSNYCGSQSNLEILQERSGFEFLPENSAPLIADLYLQLGCDSVLP